MKKVLNRVIRNFIMKKFPEIKDFWFDIDDGTWRCAHRDDFLEALEKPGTSTQVISATSISQLIEFLCKEDDIN